MRHDTTYRSHLEPSPLLDQEFDGDVHLSQLDRHISEVRRNHAQRYAQLDWLS